MDATWMVVNGRLVAKDKFGREVAAWEDPEGLGLGLSMALNSCKALSSTLLDPAGQTTNLGKAPLRFPLSS